jgi:radical SAM protein with 4Fe4S-binding SPASM domain
MTTLSGRSLDLELTRRCNLRCDYCFVGWSRGWTGDLPMELARQIITEGRGRFPVLHFTGGEPFVYRGLLELIDLGIAQGYGDIVINTNGTLVDAEWVSQLSKRAAHVRITVSLDGPQPLHDAVRGPGSFERSSQTVSQLLEAGVPTTVMTVVTRTVLDGLSAFLSSLAERHPRLSGVTLFPVGVGGSGTHKPKAIVHSLTPDDVRELALKVVFADKQGLRVGVGAYPIINPLLQALGYPEERLYACTAGRGRVCVHSDLSVSPCHPVKEAVYGAWRSGLFNTIPGLAAHRQFATRDFAGCRTCSRKEACGNCRAFVTAAGAPLMGNDEVCDEILADVPERPEQPAQAAVP